MVFTEHMALKYAFQKNHIHGSTSRLLDFFSKYDFKVIYRPGKTNQAADFISKPYDVGDENRLSERDAICFLSTRKICSIS